MTSLCQRILESSSDWNWDPWEDQWSVVSHTDDITNVLPSIWAFKVKQYPDGTIKKFKGCFCARGDKQIQGVDFFETYSPVVQWTTIRLMLVLKCILGLCSQQGNITCAFLHASLGKDETIYIEMPQGFKQHYKNGKPMVQKLNQMLYGLCQSPPAFWLYLTDPTWSMPLHWQSCHLHCLHWWLAILES